MTGFSKSEVKNSGPVLRSAEMQGQMGYIFPSGFRLSGQLLYSET